VVSNLSSQYLAVLKNFFVCHPERREGSRFFGRDAPSE
jgi:hypothetical protein